MNWTITGASGLLGANAILALHNRGQQATGIVSHRRPLSGTLKPVDLSRADERRDLVARIGGTAILNAAALANVEDCHKDPEAAYEINVRAAADLARQAHAQGVDFIHVSTDAVFDGTVGSYAEDAPTSPTSTYGRSKRDSEKAVLDAHPTALVARVNFYGWSPSGSRSLLEFFVNNFAQGLSVTGFTDIRVSSMYVTSLIDSLFAAHARGVTGLLHVASAEGTTKFDFGRRVARQFGFEPELVRPGRSTEVLTHDRGNDLTLNVQRFERLVGKLPDQRAGILSAHSDSVTVRDQLRQMKGNQ